MFKVIEGWGGHSSLWLNDDVSVIREFADASAAQAFSESYYDSQLMPDSDGFTMVNWQSYFVVVVTDAELFLSADSLEQNYLAMRALLDPMGYRGV